jgi:UPF0755 protein
MLKRTAGYAGTLFFIALALWWGWAAYQRQRNWAPIAMPETSARVPAGWEVATLAARLQKTGKVRDSATFVEAAHRVGLQRVAAGGYRLPAMAGPLDLARIFKAPPATIKLTFPEGFTALQMARRLQKCGVAAAAAFQLLAYPPGQAVSPLEGTLFPETYQIPLHATAPQIVAQLQAGYRAALKTLPHHLPAAAAGRPLSLREVTILASVVLCDTCVPAERPLVAGVLLNRLRRGQRLQCDATVQYARQLAAARGQLAQGHKARLLWRDLKLDSPYNTYRHPGLPPGPICNPGIAALRAAAAPAATPYLYYVQSAKRGRHLFATTFEQHQHNIRIVRAGG